MNDQEPYPSDSQASGSSSPSATQRITGLILGAICVIYLINPTAGILELIPDNIPIVGNLDEAAAVAGIIAAMRTLGWINISRRK